MVMIGLSPVGGGKCRKGTKRRQIVARSSEGTWEGEGEREAGYGRHRRTDPPAAPPALEKNEGAEPHVFGALSRGGCAKKTIS